MAKSEKLNKIKNLHKRGIIAEFREFALKGNVIDMAVGVVVGAAFSAIVNSFVKDIILPLVGFLTAGQDFTQMKFEFGDGDAIAYGNFIQTVVNFFIIAFSIFVVVKIINKLRNPKDTSPPVKEADVLVEIRDILKDKSTRRD
jgi:large conductance mechanosensitive channel